MGPWHLWAVSESLVGRMLGSYRIERELGQGGMGAVYVGRHARTGRAYAVKVLLAAHAGQKDALRRFRREAEALSAVGHAHIVAIHDYDETPDGLWYLVMDLLEGEDLAQRLRRTGPMPYAEAIALLDPILSAIDAAHRMGLIHRDLKPSNVFLARMAGAEHDKPMLLDFGLARALDEVGDQSKVTATGTVLGTPSYMSPEQAQGTPLDGRSDLWALAIMLFEMISGRPPFEGPTLTSILVAVLTSPRPRLRDRGIDVPETLEQALDRALAKTPAERFADVASFRAALAQIGGLSRRTQPQALAVAPTQAMATPQAIPAVGGQLDVSFAPTQAATPITPMPEMSPAVVPVRHGPGYAPVAAAGSRVGAWAWVALGSALIFVMGAGGVLLLLLTRSASSHSEVRVEAPAAPVSANVPLPDAGHAGDSGAPDAAGATSDAATAPDAGTARAVRERRRRDVATAESEPENAAASESAAPTSGPPAALVRATERMAVSDFDGCLRELEHAGTSAPILGARMNCAMRTGRRSDLEQACALLHRYQPTHAYTRTCDTVLGVTP